MQDEREEKTRQEKMKDEREEKTRQEKTKDKTKEKVKENMKDKRRSRDQKIKRDCREIEMKGDERKEDFFKKCLRTPKSAR